MAKAQRLLFAKDDPADDPRNRGDDVMPPDLLAPFTSGAEKRSSTTRFRALVVILVAASVVATLLGGETVQTFLVPVFRNNGSGGSKLSKLGTAENVRRKPHPQLATMNDAMQERLVREANKFVVRGKLLSLRLKP